jgi:uncharacterized membrane protein
MRPRFYSGFDCLTGGLLVFIVWTVVLVVLALVFIYEILPAITAILSLT